MVCGYTCKTKRFSFWLTVNKGPFNPGPSGAGGQGEDNAGNAGDVAWARGAMDETIVMAANAAAKSLRWVHWFFSVGNKLDHSAMAAIATAMLLLRSNAAHQLARQQHALGRVLRLFHLFVPKFPLLSIIGIVLLWRSWRERQLLARELNALSDTRKELQGSVQTLQQEEGRLRAANSTLENHCTEMAQTNNKLVETEANLRGSVANLEHQNGELSKSMALEREALAQLTEQNEQLFKTTDKLRTVVKIVGDNNDDLHAVERKLFSAVDELAELNAQMKENNLEQRRRQLRDIFMKFDVDFESKISDERQLRHMAQYVKSVYDAKMESLNLCLGDDGTLAWEDFEAALLKDNFWNKEHLPHERHFHATKPSKA